MEFEYDWVKSETNKEKHGIDFEEAQRLWGGPIYETRAEARNDDVRYLVLGMIDDKHWTAITTKRNGRVRIISVRRSRDYEREAYDGFCGNC